MAKGRLRGWLSGVLFSFFGIVAQGAYDLPPDYETWSGGNKESYLLNTYIIPTVYTKLPQQGFYNVCALLTLDAKASTRHNSDCMPQGRQKLIHSHGSVASVAFEAAPNSPYTGLFQGAPHGLVRASLAGPIFGPLPVVPGVAFKWFVDGKPSVNVFAMPSIEGQGKNHNFFANSFFTSIAEPQKFITNFLLMRLRDASPTPHLLSIAHMASVNADGTPVGTLRGPKVLELVPSTEVQMPTKYDKDLREFFVEFPAQGELFTVYEYLPVEKKRGALLGRILRTSAFYNSQWADEKLFFRHRTVEQDLG